MERVVYSGRSASFHISMDDNKVEVTCKNCSATFVAFLRGMAAQNIKVTCPHCGAIQDYVPEQKDDSSVAPLSK